MKLLLVDNVHLYKDSNGNYYAPSIYNYAFMQRYLKVFDEVRFLGKVKIISEEDKSKYSLVSGKGVEILEIPWYQGIGQLLKKLKKIFPVYRNAIRGCDCCIYRIAQMESYIVYLLGGRKLPYAVEVVNDPESWTDMSVIIRVLSARMMKKMIHHSYGAAFVTKEILQRKYLSGSKKALYTANYSSVELKDSDIAHEPINPTTDKPFKIVHVSNLINNDMKGHKTLINAAKIIIDQGYDLKIEFIGTGEKIEEFKQFAETLCIGEEIDFIGRINNMDELYKKLKCYNMMVFPSRSEGLPRTLVEGMAIGLPCLSSPVGGIPELLEDKYLFAPDDAEGFAKMIIHLIEEPNEMLEMSKKNLEKVQEFSKTKLEKKRIEFYRHLKDMICQDALR